MSNHQKRLAVPKSWPVARKEETYTTKAGAGPHGEEGVPLLIVLRDVLGYVDSKKEARYALGQDSVLVNGDPVSDERVPIGMFDILAFLEREEYYRVFPDEGGRLSLTPVDEDAAGSKLGKIVGKTQVPGGDTQLTLHDGRTLLVDDGTYATNDSIVVSNDGDEIVAHFTYEEGALVTAVRGGHAGRIGTIEEIQVTPGSSDNNVIVDAAAGDDFETVEEFVVVIDENFTSDSEAGAESARAGAESATSDTESATDESIVDDAAEEPDVDEDDTADEEPDVDEDDAADEDPDVEEEPVDDGDAADEDETADEDEQAAEADSEADETEEAEDSPDEDEDPEDGGDEQ